MKNEIKHSKISWKRILVFFIIATTISNVFRFDIFELKPELEKSPTWICWIIARCRAFPISPANIAFSVSFKFIIHPPTLNIYAFGIGHKKSGLFNFITSYLCFCHFKVFGNWPVNTGRYTAINTDNLTCNKRRCLRC